MSLKISNVLQLKLAFLYFLIIIVCVNTNNEFIIDYFVHKKATNVVGFSCNVKKEDICLIKEMNKMGIKMMLYRSNNRSTHELIRTEYYNLGVFIDLRCSSRINIITAFSEAHFLESHSWLLLGRNLEEVELLVRNAAFSISTDFAVAVGSDIPEGYDLYDAYNPWKSGGGRLTLTRLGTWSQESRLRISLEGSKFTRRSNLQGLALRTAYLGSKYKPINTTIEDYLENSEIGPIDGLSKFGFIVLKYISEMFNFSLHTTQVAKWEKGDVIGPMARALHNNEIDIGGSPVVMIVPRFHMAKFVYPSWPFRTCFIFRSPQQKSLKFQEVLRPFVVKVWNLTAIILVLCMFFLCSTLRFENRDTILTRSSNSFLIAVGALCQQATNFNVHQTSTRITFLCLMVFSLLVYHFYSASFVSVRLHEPILKINDSLNELAKTGFEVSAEPLLYFDFFIKDNKWETKLFYTQRWVNTPEEKRFIHPREGMKLVQKGGFAYHTFPDVGYPYVNRFYDNRQICELSEVNLVRPTYSAMALTYNSTFVEMMKIGFAKLSEFGIRQRQVDRFTAMKPRCRPDVTSASSIDIYEFVPQLFILIVGLICASIICVIENVIFYKGCKSKLLFEKRKIINLS